MMRLIFMLLFSLVLSRFVSGTEYYPSTYDDADIDVILNNERLLNQYMACILDKGPCTADGRSLKHIFPDAMLTSCAKCNVKQKQIARKISSHLKQHKPQIWRAFIEKYDPKKEHVAAFEEFLTRVDK